MQKLFTFILLVWTLQAGAQSPCYVPLTDASGYTPTQAQLNELEAAACRLRDSLPAEFQSSFKVFDFGFYLHNETFTGGYPEAFQMAIQQAQNQSDYYLLFGKQTDQNGMYTKFWVDLVLPDTAGFSCVDLVSPSFRNNLKLKTDYIVNESYDQLGNTASSYDVAEIAAMDSLATIISSIVLCCDPLRQSVSSCSFCLFNDSQIYNIFVKNGFISIHIEVVSFPSKPDLIRESRMSLTGEFLDLANATIILDSIQFRIDKSLDTILLTIPSSENAKFVLTENESFCEIDFYAMLEELKSQAYGYFQWIHVWENSSTPSASKMFVRFDFSFNGIQRNIGFETHIVINDSTLAPNVDLDYINNSILNIYSKNGFIINEVVFHKKFAPSNPDFDDLYIRIQPNGAAQVLGVTYYQNVGRYRILTDTASYLKYDVFENNLLSGDKPITRDYLIGYAISHEFLHQILKKSFFFIFDYDANPEYDTNENFQIGTPGGMHVGDAKNLLFPGDGLGIFPSSQFALLKHKNCGNCVQNLYFSKDYLPKTNSGTTSPWEMIIEKHKELISMCAMLRGVEVEFGGNTSAAFVLLRRMFNTTIMTNEYYNNED